MATPRELADNAEGFILGRWFESIAGLVEDHASIAGTDRTKRVEYDRTTAGKLGRSFNATSKDERLESDRERARAARHIYKLEPKGGFGLDRGHLNAIAEAGITSSLADFKTDALVEKMKLLIETGKRHGIGIAVHALEEGYIAIDITPPPQPKPAPKPAPPKFKRDHGF